MIATLIRSRKDGCLKAVIPEKNETNISDSIKARLKEFELKLYESWLEPMSVTNDNASLKHNNSPMEYISGTGVSTLLCQKWKWHE